MNLLAERTVPPLRGRIVECPCGMEACHEVFVLLQMAGAHEALWLTTGVCRTLDEGVLQLDGLLERWGAPVDGLALRDVIERGTALIGMTWEELGREGGERLEEQIEAWINLPEWMERLPGGYLWATRGVVFGRPLTRVVRALQAADYYYVPDIDIVTAGLRPEGLEQPGEWGVVDHPLAETLARPDRWYDRRGG